MVLIKREREIQMLNYKTPTLEELTARSRELFSSTYLQEQWVKVSHDLYQSGQHILLTGQYPNGKVY